MRCCFIETLPPRSPERYAFAGAVPFCLFSVNAGVLLIGWSAGTVAAGMLFGATLILRHVGGVVC